MEKPGWKYDQGRTLDELQDWSTWRDAEGNTHKIPDPAKGFGDLKKVSKKIVEIDKASPGGFDEVKKRLAMNTEKAKIIDSLFENRRVTFHPEALSKSDSDIKSHFGNDIDSVKKASENRFHLFLKDF